MRKAIFNKMCGTCVHGSIDGEDGIPGAVHCIAALAGECSTVCNWASYKQAQGEMLIDRILEFRFGYAPKIR